MDQKDVKQVNIKIDLDENVAQGMYINMAVVQHSSAEFIFDFIFVTPGKPQAKVRSRIIMAPEHAKRFFNVLRENIKHYEGRFGEIRIPEPAPVQKTTMQ
jgi:hypothetical protein